MPIMEEQEELRQSFQNEGYTYVSRARELLAALVDPSTQQELESLAGATRMLKQRASLAGMLDISNLAYQLEGEIRRLEETEAEMTVDTHETLGSYVDSIEQFLFFYYNHSEAGAPVEQLLKPDEGFQLTRQIQELYLVESREHIQDINDLLLALEAGSADPAQSLEEIYRNVHSIKGDSNALSLSDVADKAHQLENFLSELQLTNRPDADQLETLFAEIAALEQLVMTASGAMPQPEQPAQAEPAPKTKGKKGKGKKQAAVQDEPEAQPDASVETAEAAEMAAEPEAEPVAVEAAADAEEDEIQDSDLDYLFENQEILELYYQESQDLLSEIGTGLAQIEEHGSDSALIGDMYRAAHTLKGNSYALGVESIGKLAQSLEEAMSPLRAVQHCKPEEVPGLQQLLRPVQRGIDKIGKRLRGETAPVATSAPVTMAPASAPAAVLPFDPAELDIPEEIRQIFLEETGELLDNVNQQLLALELGQIPLKQALDEIFRSIHTLKGNSNALGLEKIGEIAHVFESYLEQLREDPTRFTGPEPLFQQIEPLQAVFSRLSGGDSEATAGEMAQSIDLSEIPEEIRLVFLEEAQELLETVSHQLLDLEQGQTSLESALEEVYRAVHTLKGNANALGLGWIGESAHTMESLLSTLRENPSSYGPATTEALFKHLEILRRHGEALRLASEQEQAGPEPERPVDIRRTTSDLTPNLITQERTPQQVVEAVRRDKSLFDEFEQKISAGRKEIDVRTTAEIKGEKAQTAAAAPAAVDETIRVSIGKVDKLINLADELLISRISFEQHLRTLRGMVNLFETAQQQFRNQLEKADEATLERLMPLQASLNRLEAETGNLAKGIRKNNAAFGLLVDEIQYNARSTRMLPAAFLLNPLRLVVRNTSAKLSKKVQLQIIGEEIEMDRLLIERLKDPLAHLLRNAIDHGVETPEQRTATGKPPEAKITVAISVAGNMIRFQIHDDGRGLDYGRIRAKAVRNGMIGADMAEQLSEYDLHNLLFSPGFTTTEQVTDISGRGVGLDVVKSTLDALNGNIEVTSSAGRGTIFTLLVPVTLTTFDAFLVQLSGHTFALPRSSVMATLSVKPQDVTDNGISKAIFYADEPVRLVSLQQLLQLPELEREDEEFAVLVVESGQQRLALMVDTVTESQQMVMKTLGSQLKKVPYISGATLLGSGEPVVVLNLTEIVSQLANLGSERMSVMVASRPMEESTTRRKGKTRVLVVDDSVTTRTLEKNILEAAGFEVVIAKNGKEGQETVIREMPNLDLVITDVEMPKMTGYEFASWLKLESEYRHTPVIMVTSLASPEFKAKGFASGIDAYIVKGEFNQQTLLDTISQLLVSA